MTRIRSATIIGVAALLLLVGTATAQADWVPVATAPFHGYPAGTHPPGGWSAPAGWHVSAVRPVVRHATVRHATRIETVTMTMVGVAHVAQMKALPEGF